MEEQCGCGHSHEDKVEQAQQSSSKAETNSNEEMEEIDVCTKCEKPVEECTCPCDDCGKAEEECTCPCDECGKEECECIPEDVEDIAEHADDKVDALIELLIDKGIISEDEYRKAYEDMFVENKEDKPDQEDQEKSEHPGDPIAN